MVPMPTLHESVMEDSFRDFVERDPDWAPFIQDVRGRLKEWPRWYVDMIGQGRGMDRDGQVHALVLVNSSIHCAEVLIAEIDIGEEPGPDADVDGNNNKLANLPEPFSAEFDPGPRKRGDGVLRWGAPVKFGYLGCKGHETDSEPCPASLKVSTELPPGNVNIEVGHTKPSRTFMHLNEFHFGVARWPYGSKKVFVLVRTPESVAEIFKRVGF